MKKNPKTDKWFIFKRLFCKHDMDLIRWHWVHFPDFEPISVEAEYQCEKCGKFERIHLYDYEAKQWAEVLQDYKKVS